MEFKIQNRPIGNNHPVFIIAELSANHNQQLQLAIDTIKAAKEAGADAIKLQTYTPNTITIDCNNQYFKINQGTIWDGQTLYELYKKAYTPWEWHQNLKKVANDLGLICFSSPFDFSAVDFLETLDMPAYKIASFEITDIPLIEYVAKKNKPILISTGVATLEDIELAVNTCRNAGNNSIALLKCTSAYPAPLEEANLACIPHLETMFNTVVGLSDHTLGSVTTIASVAIGAKIIEKHFILSRSLGGPDSAFSMEPDEFRMMTQTIRETEKALGTCSFQLSEKTIRSREHTKSLFIVADIKKGEKFTPQNLRSIRPGFGLHPKHYYDVLGKTASQDIKRGTPMHIDFIASF